MAFDAYLQIDGIEGESSDAGHEKWIQIQSFNHAVANETTGQSGGGHHTGGRCSHSDIVIVKPLDSASPNLSLACCSGKSHPELTIELCRSGASGTDAVPYQKIELTDVVITSVAPVASQSSDFPAETVTFTYGTITWTYTKTDITGNPAGEIVTGWDLKRNTAL